jgi:hypothetical protein
VAISKVQSVTGTGTVLSLTTSAGNWLTLMSSAFNSSGVTAESTAVASVGASSKTVLVQDKLAAALSTQGVLASIFYVENTVAGVHSVTPQNFGAGSQNRTLAEFSGLVTSSSLDVKASANTNNSNHTTQVSSTTASTGQADELIMIACTLAGTPGSAAVGWTDPVSTFTTLQKASNDSTDIAGLHAFKVVSASGTQSATFNWTDASASQTSQALIGAYKAAAAGAATASLLLLLGNLQGGGEMGALSGNFR